MIDSSSKGYLGGGGKLARPSRPAFCLTCSASASFQITMEVSSLTHYTISLLRSSIALDTVAAFAEPSIVTKFENSAVFDAPPDLRDSFEQEVEAVSSFLDRVSGLLQPQKESAYCRKLLSGLSDSKVGLYSQFHDNACYKLGYDNEETIRLAYM